MKLFVEGVRGLGVGIGRGGKEKGGEKMRE